MVHKQRGRVAAKYISPVTTGKWMWGGCVSVGIDRLRSTAGGRASASREIVIRRSFGGAGRVDSPNSPAVQRGKRDQVA